VTNVDKFPLNYTVLPAANLNCYDYVTYFYKVCFPDCSNVVYKLFKINTPFFGSRDWRRQIST